MKVLITGGCGFLGSNLTAFYLEQGAEVVIIDALFRKGSAFNLAWLQQRNNNRHLHFYQIDISKHEDISSVFLRHAPFDYVCHVGGQAAMTTSIEDPRRDFDTNVIGTFNILEAIRKHSPSSLLAYSSTNKVYGNLEWLRYVETETRYTLPDYPLGLDESIPLDFSTPYGCSKGSADQYVRDWARVFGLKTVVFRHSSIYGNRQFASFDQGWIGWFCQQALQQRLNIADPAGTPSSPFTISGNGKQVRDALHSTDLISLYHAAFLNKDSLHGDIFNIGGGSTNSLSILELLSHLSEILDMPPLTYVRIGRRMNDQDFFVADITKAKRMLQWSPRIDIRNGLSEMISWTNERGAIQTQ